MINHAWPGRSPAVDLVLRGQKAGGGHLHAEDVPIARAAASSDSNGIGIYRWLGLLQIEDLAS